MTIAMAATFQQITTATQAAIVFYAASNCQQMFKSKKLKKKEKKIKANIYGNFRSNQATANKIKIKKKKPTKKN